MSLSINLDFIHLPKQLDCTGSNAICHMVEIELAFCENKDELKITYELLNLSVVG